jgi:type IV pilus assembly protein PilC
MLFKYKAKTKTGEIIEGTIEAQDRFSVSRDLRAKGNIPIAISGTGGELSLDNLIEKFFGKVKLSELIIFTRNLSGMLKAGLPLARALSVVEKQTKNSTFKKILNDLQNEINSGGTFSSGLTKYPKVFSKLFVSMVRAGEESGNLSNALLEVGMNLNKSYTLTKKVKGAMIYPSVILGAMVIIGILLFAFVVPTLAKTFVELGVKLPATTRFIIALGNFFSHYLIFALLGVFALGFGGYRLFKAKFMAKYIDFVVIRIPVIGNIAKEVNTARTARTMSSLLLSGVADKIHNTESILRDMNRDDGLPSSKFHSSLRNRLWFHEQVLIIIKEKLGDEHMLVKRLSTCTESFKALVASREGV